MEKVTKTKESRDAGKNIRKRKVEPKPTQPTAEARRERSTGTCVMSVSRHDKGRENKKQNAENDDRTNPK